MSEQYLPLSGRRVVITRARSQASELSRMVQQLGGETYEFPVIGVDVPDDLGPLDAAISELSAFDWIIFTSVNGVEMFWQRLKQHNRGIESFGQARFAVVGPKTAEALAAHGAEVAVTAKEYVGEGLVEALEGHVQPGQRVLLPRANIARKNVPDALRDWGCQVTEVDAYKTQLVAENADELAQRFHAQEIQIVTFTSASTVKNFVKALAGYDVKRLLQGVTVAVIGPVTANAAAEFDLHVDVMPDTYTIPGLVDAVVRFVREQEVHP